MAYNILIVDDSATTRAMIKRTIKLTGLPVESVFDAPDGKAALEVLEDLRVDLVLADLHMPVMSGVEMTRRIIANPATRHIPVIIVSADPNVARIEELRREGARAYLPKPFTPESIKNVLEQVLGAAHA